MAQGEDSKDPLNGPPSPQVDEYIIGDNPPAYDAVATESSSSTAGSGSRAVEARLPPKDTLYLFSGPKNVENLLGRSETPEAVLNSIEYTEHNGMIYSTDRRLQNGTTLYDWVRRQALIHPSLRIRCEGAHFDTPTRTEYVTDENGPRHRTKGQPERIVDFNFTIDLAPVFVHPDNFGNVHIAIAQPDQPVPRGTPSPSVAGDFAPNEYNRDANGYQAMQGPLDSGRLAWKNEIKAYRDWETWRVGRGLPPWVRAQDTPAFLNREQGKGKASKGVALPENGEVDVGAEERGVGDSSAQAVEASLREWCNKYAADTGYLKEFWVPKDFWGWDLEGLKTAIRGAITSTGYNSNDLTVKVEPRQTGLVVRPNNWLSKMVNNSFVYFLLCITFIYPIIWIWQHFHPRAGGPYRVSTINYAFKFYPPLPSTFPGETLEQAQSRLGGMYKIHPELPKPTTLVPGPKGIHYLLGRKEGEWFREWEERIRMGVRMRFKGELVGGGEQEAGTGLDGY